MLNLCKGHVFVELNYPHNIGDWGYERHHDVARMTTRSRPERRAPIGPDRAAEASRQTIANQGQSSDQSPSAKGRENTGSENNPPELQGLEGLTAASTRAVKTSAA